MHKYLSVLGAHGCACLGRRGEAAGLRYMEGVDWQTGRAAAGTPTGINADAHSKDIRFTRTPVWTMKGVQALGFVQAEILSRRPKRCGPCCLQNAEVGESCEPPETPIQTALCAMSCEQKYQTSRSLLSHRSHADMSSPRAGNWEELIS